MRSYCSCKREEVHYTLLVNSPINHKIKTGFCASEDLLSPQSTASSERSSGDTRGTGSATGIVPFLKSKCLSCCRTTTVIGGVSTARQSINPCSSGLSGPENCIARNQDLHACHHHHHNHPLSSPASLLCDDDKLSILVPLLPSRSLKPIPMRTVSVTQVSCNLQGRNTGTARDFSSAPTINARFNLRTFEHSLYLS